jgi:hypothetical protein
MDAFANGVFLTVCFYPHLGSTSELAPQQALCATHFPSTFILCIIMIQCTLKPAFCLLHFLFGTFVRTGAAASEHLGIPWLNPVSETTQLSSSAAGRTSE